MGQAGGIAVYLCDAVGANIEVRNC